MQRSLLESLSKAVAAQTSHNIPAVGGPVSSLALHYGLGYLGDAAYKRISKNKKRKKLYDRVFRSRDPKERPGKFVADLTSLGGTAAGVHAGEKLFHGSSSKKALLAKIALGVAGHSAGNMVGNRLGNRLNRYLYVTKRNKNR